MERLRRSIRDWKQLTGALGVGAALLLSGCAVPAQSATPRAVPVPAVARNAETSAGKRDAQILGTALQFLLLEDRQYANEPRGDVRPAGLERVYAYISRVTTAPATITFDIAQFYQGDAAVREAAKGGSPPPQEDQIYERNEFRHSQTMSVAASAGVVGQFVGEADPTYGVENAAQFTPLAFDDFAGRYAAEDPVRRTKTGYWIEFDEDGVQNVVKQYRP